MERIKITELDHIVLNVSDIERSLKFYTECWACRPSASRVQSGQSRFSVGAHQRRHDHRFVSRSMPRIALQRAKSDRATSIILHGGRGERISPASSITWRDTKSPSAKGRCRAGAPAAGRLRCIFSIPTATKSRSVAIDPGFWMFGVDVRIHQAYAFCGLLEFDLDDAPSFHIDDGEFVAVFFDPFAAARDAFQPGQDRSRPAYDNPAIPRTADRSRPSDL